MRAALRRCVLAGLIALAAPAAAPAEGPEATPVLVISQDRVLREAEAPAALAEREKQETLTLQAEIEAERAALQAEEAELAGLRGTLPDDEFEARANDFDERMRAARRSAQERITGLQARFRIGRERIIRYLPSILAEVAQARGAQLVIDTSSVLIASPAIDVTDEVIAAFDRRLGAGALERLLPRVAPPPPPDEDGAPDEAPMPTDAPAPAE